MASQAPTTQKSSSRWGSFLANVESRLDTILADDDNASKTPNKTDGKVQEQPTKKEGMAIPAGNSASQSRTPSANRAQDRLNEKLARAMANRNLAKKTEGSAPTSTTPSRTASPVNGIEPLRNSTDMQLDTKTGGTAQTEVQEDPVVESAATHPPGKEKEGEVDAVQETGEKHVGTPDGLVSSLPPHAIRQALQESVVGRQSIDSRESGSARQSLEINQSLASPQIPGSPEVNGIEFIKTPKSLDEYAVEVAQLKLENEASELRRQEEILNYMERIDAMQAKLNYLAKEAAETAKNASSTAKPGSLEQQVADKDQKIALLIEEGQKLSQTELKHMNIIKKLRAKSSEDEKSAAEARMATEKYQNTAKDAQEKAKRAELAERQANEKLKNMPRMEKEIESLKFDKEANESLVRDLQFQLAVATSAAKEAEDRARAEALEQERKRATALAEELSSLRTEKELTDKSYQNELREFKEKAERERERTRIAEIERQAEQDALQSRLETYRARAEEASAGQGGDVHAKLLRQVETLQNQYAVASENWQGIEGSLLSRVATLERERDDISKKESEVRRKAREANIRCRRQEEESEQANIRISELENDLFSNASQMAILEERVSNTGKEIVKVRDELRMEREAQDAQLSARLEEERMKVREELIRTTPDPQQIRTDSPILRTRKPSVPERASPAHGRRLPSSQTLPGLMIAGNGHLPTERSLSRHSSEKRIVSASSDFAYVGQPARTDSMSTIPQVSVNNGIPETPTFSETREDDGFFDDLATPATPERTINDLISVSTAGAGPSVQLVERMSAAVRRLESEKAAHKDELSRLASQRDEARDQVVELMRDNEGKKASDDRVKMLATELNEIKDRYMTTLEMLGEKSEKVEELKADVDDLKAMYRELVERTTR